MAKKPLNNKMLKCINLLVYSDMSKGAIAEELKVSKTTVSTWIARDDFQEALKNEMNQRFKVMATKAIKKLDKLVDSSNEKVALDASKEVLNKAGYQETQKVEQTFNDITIEITGNDSPQDR